MDSKRQKLCLLQTSYLPPPQPPADLLVWEVGSLERGLLSFLLELWGLAEIVPVLAVWPSGPTIIGQVVLTFWTSVPISGSCWSLVEPPSYCSYKDSKRMS